MARLDTGRLSMHPRPCDVARAHRPRRRQRPRRSARTGSSYSRTRRPAPASGPTPTSSPRSSPTSLENAIRHGSRPGARSPRRSDGDAGRRPGRRRRATASRPRSGSGCSPSSGPPASAAGPGLGLYLVNGLVRAHGGTVTIDDAPAGGARIVDHLAGVRHRRDLTASDRPGKPGRGAAGGLPRLCGTHAQHAPDTAKGTHVGPEHRLRPGRGHPAPAGAGRGRRATTRWPRSPPPPTSPRSSRPGSTTPATGRRWRWPTGRSARCRRRPARRPASGSARPAARSTRRSPSGTAVLEAEHEERMLVEETVDVTLPTDRRPRGARHPLTTDVRATSPTSSWPWAGRSPRGRCSRPSGSTSTPSTSGPTTRPAPCRTPSGPSRPTTTLVLRTHTSPVQARTMLTRTPPIYVICPGRVFRTDEYDATHIADVPPGRGPRRRRGHHHGPPQGHARPLRRSRCSARASRPGSARRTSPSPSRRAEVDLVCFVCRGVARQVETCRTCKGEGWIEWGGCGVVNPRVLAACGIDAERYTRLRVRHGHRPDADVPHTASRTCASSSRATSGSPPPSERRSDA